MTASSHRIILVFGAERFETWFFGDALKRVPDAKPVWIPIHVTTPVSDLLAHQPCIALLHSEWAPQWASAAAQLRQAGVPVVVVMDGTIEWSYLWSVEKNREDWAPFFRPLLSSHLAVIGRHPARILSSLGLGPQIHVVGLPRTDRTPRTRVVDRSSPHRILIATAYTYGHELYQKSSVRQGLEDLKTFFDAHPSIDPVWRIDADLAREIQVVPEDLSTPIESSLARASGVISFTSTVLLEAMLKGIPTAQIDYRAVPMFVQTAWEIRNADHIEPVVQELLHPPAQKMAYQDFCLEDELEPGDASRRLADLILGLTGEGAMSPPVPAPLPAPDPRGQLDYRLVHPQVSAFAISSKSRLQYELQCAYLCLEKVRTINRLYRSLRKSFPLRMARLLPWLPGFKNAANLMAEIDNT